MVFESIVVELINRYLGTFVENLDTSQLKIGIWGGDVVLNNLNLQESALDDLDLPVKVKAGHISKLTLKIPWKNLYTEPVIAHLDGIYALAVPNIAIKYDAEKEAKAAQDAKVAKLASIDEQKRLEAEKDKGDTKKKDSFAEKLATQVIKNLQVRVGSIHVRYEDKYTNPSRPFAVGVTLQELLFQTTDSSWKETVIKEAVTQIYKLVRLDCLSVYWNSNATLLQDKPKPEILSEIESMLSDQKTLTENIPKQGKKANLQYLFKPISAVAHLRLNTKPELTDFSLPKVFLTLVFDEIAISLAKSQYDDVLEMLESMERMALMAQYKKTRPAVDYSHKKEWWHHAYQTVLEHTVQRRRQMWSWTNIKEHRDTLRQYRAVYTRFLDVGPKKLSVADNKLIKECEDKLDIFNITLCRNQAEMDAQRLGKKREEEKASSGGWLGGWFGGGKKKEANKQDAETSEDDALGAKLQEEFNSQEKAKLYKAIGYDENAKDPTFPVEYVAVRLVTKLNKLSVTLVDSKQKDRQLLRLSLTEICSSFGQRPAAGAIRLDAKVDRLRVTGIPRDDYLPKLVSSVGTGNKDDNSTSLLMLAVETKPMDELCDTRVRVQSRPIEVIYDAITVNSLATFFKPPESVRLKQLSNMAMARYDVIKAQTQAGMLHMMGERKYADIEVNLMPSYVIVPATGELSKDVTLLLLNLGSFNINSQKTDALNPGVQYSQQELEDYSYDKFNISLDNLQLLYIQPGDTWQDENRLSTSPLYLLRPLSLRLVLEKCVFGHDPNLPQIRLSGEIPLLALTISDNKLLGVMKLVNSIPLPEAGEAKVEEILEDETVVSSDARMSIDDVIHLQPGDTSGTEKDKTAEMTNFTKATVSFIVKEITAELRETKDDVELPFLRLSIIGVGVSLKARSYDLSVDAFLGGIYLQHLQYKVAEGIRMQLAKCNVITGELINIINSPDVSEDGHLLSVNFLQADSKGPEFHTTYKSTAQSVSVEFSTLELVLHQGVVLSLLEFAQKLKPPEASKSAPPPAGPPPGIRKSSHVSSTGVPAIKPRKEKKETLIQMKLKAIIDGVQLSLCNEDAVIMHTRIAGIEVGLGMEEAKSRIEAIMRHVELLDTDPKTYYPEIVSVSGEEMLKFELIQINQGTAGHAFDEPSNVDLDVRLSLGRARIVFVNKFVKSLTNFVDNFAVAQAKLDKAGQKLKEAGKDVGKSLQEAAPRVVLNIKIHAPLLVVPRSSRSFDAVLINLGDISVTSCHELVPPGPDIRLAPGKAHILEKLTAQLTNLQVSRACMGHGDTVVSQIAILEPMSFRVDVNRNLSSGWFNGIPDVEVCAVVDSIFIRVSQEDVNLGAMLAKENLEEPDPIHPNYIPAPKPRAETSSATALRESNSLSGYTTADLSTAAPQTISEDETPYSNLTLDFKLDSVNLELYRGLYPLTKGLQKRDTTKMLSALSIRLLKVDLNMMSDSSMVACVKLSDLIMDDCRSERKGGITRMISLASFNKCVEDNPDESLIFISFKQNSQQDKVLLTTISSIHVCVCLDFLMRVKDFFLGALPETDKATIDEATAAQKEFDRRAAETAATKSQLEPAQAQAAPKGSLDLTFKLDKPEIFLIEDQMNPNTESLIVDMEVDFRMRQSPDVLSINGNIRGLSLVSCVFGRLDTKKAVLSPFNVMVIANGPVGKDQHVDISMSDFIFTISPPTIRLLSAIAGGMSVPADEEKLVPELKDYSGIWKKMNLAECGFWFTNSVVDLSSSVDEAMMATDLNQEAVEVRGEQLMVSAPNLVIKLEGGVGHRTVPLLIVEASFSGQVRNWSSDLYVESSFGLEVAYNNENIGVWEPIIEPVLDTRGAYHKWSIGLEVIKPEDNRMLDDEDSNILPPPKLTVNVTATDPLQVIMTKTCLDVLNNLGAAFSAAYKLEDMEGSLGQRIVPYVLKNRSGKEMSYVTDSSFTVSPEHGEVNLEKVETEEEVYLETVDGKESQAYVSLIRTTQNQVEKSISFKVTGENKTYQLTMQRARKIVYNFSNFKLLATVEALLGQKIITFTACVTIHSHLDIPVDILYYESANNSTVCGTVYPGLPFPVPLAAAYCSSGEMFFQPKTDAVSYSVSKESIKWKEANDKTKQMMCEASQDGKPHYYFSVKAVFEKVENHEKAPAKIGKKDKTDNSEKIVYLHLHPTVILHNRLPFAMTYSLEDKPETHNLDPGASIPLQHAAINQTKMIIQIPEYRGLSWKATRHIKQDVPELNVLTFEANDNGKDVFMDLGLHCKEIEGSFDLTVYSPYWVINLTGQDIALKEDDKDAPLSQAKDDTGIMLFFYRDKPVFGTGAKRKLKGKKQVMLKVAEAEWSDKFSLDTAGSGGNVSCKVKATGTVMEVGLNIKLASNGLTKIATFTPFYLLQNTSTVDICVREASAADGWITVLPAECKPFYPKVHAKDIKIVAKVSEAGSEESRPFFLNKAHSTLLQLGDKYGGISADCRVSETQMITVFKTYKPGMATVQLVNHTQDCVITLKQVGSSAEPISLEAQMSQLYTWEDPTGKREVIWTCGKKEGKSALVQDQLEDFYASSDNKVYLVSFLDGIQRVLMFTEDLALATVAQEAGELEQVDQEINLCIHDFGFSLVNNEKMLELAYMGITSSGVIWEEKKKRLKAMKVKDMVILEHAYQKYLMEVSTGKSKPVVMLENKLEVDFEKMEMIKPKACTIRRSFANGVWVQMRTSPHSRQFHAKINRIQFDNQLRHAVFPIILSPQPLPKSVASDSVPKPFVEVSIMTRIHEHSDLVQVKYFKVLVQEMNLQVDQGILNEIMAIFATDVSTMREKETQAFKYDMDSTKRDLKEEAGVSMKAKSVTFYDYFHVSPIKVHVSFSLQNVGSANSASPNVFGVFLQSVGVVLTDVQDVVFKLGYFERNHMFYNNSQLTSEFIGHYTRQAVMQMYVLVLGLDGLGNPFGLLRGLSEGIEDLFYEPYQGAIQGPEEFAEGLALGVRSLFGHAVGGAAGAVSRITGTLGKGLAALTLDDDYQRKRREQLNKKPATAREGFARGGKGLVMGVFDGVTGIVRKPVEGAKQEGVAGFFKGMGKGIVGVVTRPTSGVVDFASSSLEGIKRITDVTEEVRRMRPPRIFHHDGIVRPYNRVEAEGYNLLHETDKGNYSNDDYVTHVLVKADGKTVFIVTDKRLIYARRGEIFGAWDSDWVFTYSELKDIPKQIPKGIEILLKDPKKKNFFSGAVSKKEVHISDSKVVTEILAKITATMQNAKTES